MSFPMMFYQRDIITKKKNLVPPSNPLPVEEKEETPFHGRVIANGDDMLKVADKAEKKHTYSKRVIVNGPDVTLSKPKPAAPAPKPSSRRVIV
tara:strand:- start:970 stop:1248 length:279 start_codon:yes stop_codon:yes gene_type:complete